MSYGKKCNIIFIRKVRRRLEELEERYKNLTPKKRASAINIELLKDFCVDERQIRRWKRIVHVADNLTDINVREKIAEAVRPTTLYEIAKLPEQKQVEVAKKVVEKNLTVKQTKKLVKEVLWKDQPPLPTEPFNVVYADPPWTYNVKHLRGNPEKHYPTLTTKEICGMSIPSSDNAVLFLWATNPMLEDALQVMKAWGFSYKTNLVWVKNKMGVGFYLRGQHELLLIGVKGDVHPPEQSNRVASVLKADVGKHSKKPDVVYEIIEGMYPQAKYLELFARQKRQGWEAWGNEL